MSFIQSKQSGMPRPRYNIRRVIAEMFDGEVNI